MKTRCWLQRGYLMPNIKVEPRIPNYPPQGIQAQLDLLYLWNPDVANDLIDQINKALEDINNDLALYLTKDEAAATYATITTVNGKQDALTVEQLAAVNSGITAEHVTTYDAYAGEISAKVNIAQGAGNAGKVMTVGADGNVVPTAGYATESWVNQQIQTQIGTIETALAEV